MYARGRGCNPGRWNNVVPRPWPILWCHAAIHHLRWRTHSGGRAPVGRYEAADAGAAWLPADGAVFCLTDVTVPYLLQAYYGCVV